MAVHGLMTGTSWTWGGTETTADASAGATSLVVLDSDCLTVGDPLWLAADEGTTTYEVTGIDYDTETVTFTPGLAEDLDIGSPVIPDAGGRPLKVYVAEVVIEDSEEPIDVPLSWLQATSLPLGDFATPVPVVMPNDLSRIRNLKGGNLGGLLFMQDMKTAAASGDQTVVLTYEPVDSSEHMYWNGLYQPASEWTRLGQTASVADPSGWVEAGDELVVEYAYIDGGASEALSPGSLTRLYLPSSGSAPVSPAFGSGWEESGSASRRPLNLTLQNTAMTNVEIGYTFSVVPADCLMYQFVSPPMAASLMSGTWRAVVGNREVNSGGDQVLQVMVRVVSGDGLTERVVLYAGQTPTTVSTDPDDQNYEMALNSSYLTRVLSGAVPNTVVAAGDRLVVEMGFRSCRATPGQAWAELRLGDPASGTDDPYQVDFASVPGANRSWIEFSNVAFL